MDVEEFRKAGYAAIDQICDYYTTLPNRPVKSDVEPGYLIKQLPTSAPTTGQPFSEIAADFQSLVMPGITHWQHNKYTGYFPAIVTFESILGDMYSASVTNPGFNWSCSPACTELEQVTMDWMAKVLGLEEPFHGSSGKGGGVIGNSASEVALTATIAARERALRSLARAERSRAATPLPGVDQAMDVPESVRDECTRKLVMYVSTQTHSLGTKAGKILGITCRALPVTAEDGYALRGETLRKAVQEDVKAGLTPFFVTVNIKSPTEVDKLIIAPRLKTVGTVGTTSSGAVDYIAELGEVVKDYPTMFMHVDAAWAGVAFALPEQRGPLRLDEVNKYADSFCTNMHKWGLVGFDCSLFFIRDRTDLTEALDVTPAYLRTKEADSGLVIDYRNWQLSLGRRFRSIKLWFVMRSFGIEGLQTHLRTGITQCEQLAKLISATEDFEIITPPSLALLSFRLNPASLQLSDEALNRLNAALQSRLAHNPNIVLTQTVLKAASSEIYCIRFALGQYRTTQKDVDEIWAVVVDEARLTLGGWKESGVALN